MKRKPSYLTNFSRFLANISQFLANFSQVWADFEPILAKKTPEFFDKIKAGEFTLKKLTKNSLCGGSFPGKWSTKGPPHIKNGGSQIFMLGTPLILYVGILYVLFFAPPSEGYFHFARLFFETLKKDPLNVFALQPWAPETHELT